MDKAWWREYIDHAKAVCKSLVSSKQFELRDVQNVPIKEYGNSGATAVSFARHLGAEIVYLYGYDCQYTHDKRHWHSDHPKGLGNADSMPQWRRQFDRLAKDSTDIEIINISRISTLTAWPRVELEEIMGDTNEYDKNESRKTNQRHTVGA